MPGAAICWPTRLATRAHAHARGQHAHLRSEGSLALAHRSPHVASHGVPPRPSRGERCNRCNLCRPGHLVLVPPNVDFVGWFYSNVIWIVTISTPVYSFFNNLVHSHRGITLWWVEPKSIGVNKICKCNCSHRWTI